MLTIRMFLFFLQIWLPGRWFLIPHAPHFLPQAGQYWRPHWWVRTQNLQGGLSGLLNGGLGCRLPGLVLNELFLDCCCCWNGLFLWNLLETSSTSAESFPSLLLLNILAPCTAFTLARPASSAFFRSRELSLNSF